ncbi:NUDIX hydrolase [Sansalvadorimonas verongulae]|uniref:NUDIX hydrolase n=1 Tax=Sansalvadorimonas verongulae TaxID=2172824 RepID=UPI0012BC0880|nr:NUDIX hydrolase [Sansalvadorimonas verongulae]MTI14004.1 NUDIX hydrolase [Sansalvadorimonas verongulae]
MVIRHRKLLLPALLASLLVLSGCEKTPPPDCPYTSDTDAGANAGCLITRGDDVLIITMRLTGKQSIPGGTTDIGESPRCTAHRETFEETGVQVNVHELLDKFDNGFHVYRCTPVDENQVPSPQDWKEVSDVGWRSWLSLNSDNWRFPEQFERTRRMIRKQITGISKQLD